MESGAKPVEYAQEIEALLSGADGTTASTALAIAKELIVYRMITSEASSLEHQRDLHPVSQQVL